MITQETAHQLQHASVADRIQMIELILKSLKNELFQQESRQASHRPFIVREFDLGTDVQTDREEMYAERGH
jgi:hypothetical protein